MFGLNLTNYTEITIDAITTALNGRKKDECNYIRLNETNKVKIYDHAFENDFPNLEYINNVDSISSIGNYAFYNCNKLKNRAFANAKYIGDHAFENCGLTGLLNIRNCEQIGKYAFSNCQQLTSICITKIDNIADYAFNNCINLDNFYYELTSVQNIGDYAFASCYNFPDKISLTACTEIGRYAFLSCQNLSSLNAPQCTFVDYNAFYGTKLWDVDPQQ